MSGAIESAVDVAVGLQNWNLMQQKENNLLRKTLDNQANTILDLVQSVPDVPRLAHTGSVGTRIHVTA